MDERCHDEGCEREAGHDGPHRCRVYTGHGDHRVDEWTAPKPIYALWFSAKGLGPDEATIKVRDLTDPELGDDCASLGFTFQPSPGGLALGHCPFGAGPMLSRDDVEQLHAELGAWLAAHPAKEVAP